MASSTTIRLKSSMIPAALAGSALEFNFALESNLDVVGTGDTMAQIILTPDAFVEGSGSKPSIELDLDTGSDDTIVATVTAGGGAESIAYVILEKAAGVANDFDLVRAIHCHALPVNDAIASKLKALVTIGNVSADSWERQIHQLGWDSASAGQAAASCSLCVVPRGLTHATANTLNVIIYQATNAKIIINLLGE
jgi:hypothetical protein